MIIFTSLIALIAIFLFALIWQNENGTSGISWLLNKIGAILTAKNIIIAILIFILIVIVRMLQIEIGANRNLIQEIKEQRIGCEVRRTQDLQGWQEKYTILYNKIDDFKAKEPKRARKYFE